MTNEQLTTEQPLGSIRQASPQPRIPQAVTFWSPFCQLISAALLVACCGWEPSSRTLAQAPTREQKVRGDKERVEAEGFWIYNDLPKAIEQAKAEGKPMVVVLRCIPCEECVKLDDELIDGDPKLQPLLEQFVRVRIVSTNGLDLSLFQFDTDQSFAMFMLNADGTIYGRFGTRSHRTEWIGDVSIAGMAEALQGALELHRDYPANRDVLLAKRGPVPEFDRPEKFPAHQGRYTASLDYGGRVVDSCIHCHQIGDAQREVVFSRGEQLNQTMLYPYPHPKVVGWILDPDQKATLREVVSGSDADRAGFQPGDVIARLQGQPLLSMADVQWVLHSTPPEGATLIANIIRNDQPLELKLTLPPDWRRRDDIAWRVSTWELRRRALGGMFLGAVNEEEAAASKGQTERPRLKAQHVGEYSPHDLAKRAGVLKGDVLVELDGKTDFTRETDVIDYVLTHKRPGDTLRFKMLRDGEEHEFSFTLP